MVGPLIARYGVTKARDDLASESARFEKDGRVLVDSMRASLERVALEKKDFEALSLRLHALQSSVGEAEARMEALGTKERNLSQLHQKADILNESFQGLSVQADDLAKKQAGLDMLQDRLAQVEELAKRTALQHETLKRGQQEIETLRRGRPRVSQVPRAGRPASRQAGSRPRRTRSLQQADDSIHGPHAAARRHAERDQWKAGAGR